MKKQNNNFIKLLAGIPASLRWLAVLAVAAAVLALLAFVWTNRNNTVTLTQNDKIDITPAQIRSLTAIGEWEFLSINDEEMLDTVRTGFFGDAELVRIYYGTLRLGINMREAKPGWIKVENDTLAVLLPPVKLLDHNFIDEARTLSFYEKGSWSNEAREQLYQKAYRMMLRRCVTTSNIQSAQENAREQFGSLLHAMGFEKVRIRFASQ